jgi:hypothetical protein
VRNGDWAKTGCRPNIPDASRAGTPASQASRAGSASRSRCLRRQLTQLLKEGSECFNPDEVRRIIQTARAGPEGSLTAICMLDDDIALFMHAFPDTDDRELRAHCLSTLLEYEESMRVWEEVKNSGELGSDGSDSEDEDELTGIELLQDLDLPASRAPASAAPVARPGPKRVLRQTILVSGIAAEIESNMDRANWDADCYEGCRRLLLRETEADGDHLGGAGAGRDPGPGRLRGPALDGRGFGECNIRHGAHHRPSRLDECARPEPGPEGGRRPRPGGQQGNAGRDEGRDGKSPQ